MQSKETILIVDDDPLNVKLLSATLSADGYETLSAYDGKTALKIAQTEFPDLILLDIMMPEIDGYEVTEILKQNPDTKDIPIILITALDGREDKLKGLEAGADEFLNKPANAAELLARVKSLLRLKLYQDQLKVRTHPQEFIASNGKADGGPIGDLNLPSVLLVEDEDRDVRLLKSYLQGEAYHIEVAHTGEETISRVLKDKVDLILLDILLPGMDGFEVVRQLREMESAENIQVLAITSLKDMESKIRGIELGVDDYLVKPINKHELRVRVKSLVKKKAYLDTLRQGYQTAVYTAITDKLTGLYNRAYFEHYLHLEIKRADRLKDQLSLIMMDIDEFKYYNDSFGHLTGDRILRTLGKLVKESIREIDLAVRYGGEEFAFVLPTTDKEGAVAVAERLRRVVYEHSFFSEDERTDKRLSVSVGVAVYPDEALSLEALIRSADMQLYRAKREGKNRVCFHSEKDLRNSETTPFILNS